MNRAAAYPASRDLFSAAGGRLIRGLIALFFFAAQAAFALEITTTDGKTYHQCEISKVEPDALRITHTDGVARIPYDKLPSALQKQYFDPAKVAAYREQFAEQQQAAAAKAAEAERVREEAAARAEAEQKEQAAEQQREEEKRRATEQLKENLSLVAKHHKAQLATSLVVLAALVMLFLYFLPTIIARHKANALAIFVFNLFLGWSGIGWVAAMVWACSKDSAMDILARQHLSRQGTTGPAPNGGPYVGNQLPGQGQLQDEGPRRLQDGGRYIE